MKVLIAISSCYDFEKEQYNDVLRQTWLPAVAAAGMDYKFFFGSGQGAESTELPDDCVLLTESDGSYLDDGYGSLTYKTRANRRWSLDHDYHFVFQCFPDTYCRPERLADSSFAEFDYYGDFRGEHCTPDNYPSGGPGYFTSRKVNELLVDAPVKGVWRDDITPYAEDLWVGKILNLHRDKGLKYFDNPRFINRGTRGDGPLRQNDIISTHLSCPDRYFPDRMWEKHRAWLASQ